MFLDLAIGSYLSEVSQTPHAIERDSTHFRDLLSLYFATAYAEIIGFYLPYLWLKHHRSSWPPHPLTGMAIIVFAPRG